MKTPPGPFRPEFWRSPLRGPWLTAMFGAILLVAIPVVAITGLLSYAAYNPRLGSNDLTPDKGILGFYLFDWPNRPAFLYAINQGLHTVVGIVALPILLAKLWSVIPKLFTFPPFRSPAQALERLSLLLLVGGALFEFATGILNIQLYYPWSFSFLSAHFYGAWVFLGAFVAHVVIKLPTMARSLRVRRGLAPLREDLAHTAPEPAPRRVDDARAAGGLAPVAPAEPTLSRRGLFGVVGAGSVGLFLLTAGQSIGGPLRRVALLAPRGRDLGDGPQAFQVNKTAASVGVTPRQTGSGWRLALAGPRGRTLTREDLLALPQATHDLPISCVEGWSTTQTWTGVPLSALARMAGIEGDHTVLVESLQKGGPFSRTTLSADQLADPRSLLALRVNGADLSMDHGFPARIIVPALPGVHCTKWVRRLSFQAV